MSNCNEASWLSICLQVDKYPKKAKDVSIRLYGWWVGNSNDNTLPRSKNASLFFSGRLQKDTVTERWQLLYNLLYKMSSMVIHVKTAR